MKQLRKDFESATLYPPQVKIQILEEKYDLLIKADKARKDNRSGLQQICRMTGSITQSYFILDAPQNKVGRKIYYSFAD